MGGVHFLNADVENICNEIRDKLSYLTKEQLEELKEYIEGNLTQSEQQSEEEK